MSQRHSDHAQDHTDVPSDPALRVKALESLLVEKGLVDPTALDVLVDTYEHRVGPRHGAQVVARAWVDPSDSRSVLKILYDLCRIPLSEPSDDPFVACDAACTAGIESILGTKPLLASAEVELRHSHGTGASAMA